jgi:hypothetical protein
MALAGGGCAASAKAREGAGAGERRVLLEMSPGECTEEVCPETDPCCHSCAAGEWRTVQASHAVARVLGPLPVCEVDGCGRCPFALAAWGRMEGDDFVVTRWSKAPTCAPQTCDGEGSCDAVLAEGKWTWNGKACIPFYASGCQLAGPGCDYLFANRDECERKHAVCR